MQVPISFEFFPPKTDAQRDQLRRARDTLSAFNPEYYSVTFGAGGSTLDHTRDTVDELQAWQGNCAPHLSCMGGSKAGIARLLNHYRDHGVTRIVALRGDLPSGMGANADFGHANELVEFIRSEHGEHFHIEVACYPEVHPNSDCASDDLAHFKRKVDAGADGAITQYFFNPDAYRYFVAAARKIGVEVPIVPGIMPITNYTQLRRFSKLCGAEMPRWLNRRLRDYADDVDSLRAFGVDVIVDLCQKLLTDGAPALHFYTLNRATATRNILARL